MLRSSCVLGGDRSSGPAHWGVPGVLSARHNASLLRHFCNSIASRHRASHRKIMYCIVPFVKYVHDPCPHKHQSALGATRVSQCNGYTARIGPWLRNFVTAVRALHRSVREQGTPLGDCWDLPAGVSSRPVAPQAPPTYLSDSSLYPSESPALPSIDARRGRDKVVCRQGRRIDDGWRVYHCRSGAWRFHDPCRRPGRVLSYDGRSVT